MNLRLRRRTAPRRLRPDIPALRLTPYAWAKLLYLRDRGNTEVGGFGLSAPEDLLRIEDICLVRQVCSSLTVCFDDLAVADFFDDQVDRGLVPERFGRIWVHTHPGNSARPSTTDEQTFQRCFGRADWALMLILACGGQTYARLRMSTGPKIEVQLPVEVDFSGPFPGAEPGRWDQEYQQCVERELVLPLPREHLFRSRPDGLDEWGWGMPEVGEAREAQLTEEMPHA